MRHMRLMMVGLGILGVLAAGGCASTTDGAVDASPSASGTADPSQASSTASSPTQSSPAATGGSPVRTESSSSDPAADPVTPKCANADLKAGYRATDAGAG